RVSPRCPETSSATCPPWGGPFPEPPSVGIRIPEVLVKVVCLLLQLLVLPLELPEIRLELIDLKLEIGCRCSTATTTFSSQPDFGSQILLQYSDSIAYTIDHPTAILHAVNQGHSIMLILATSKTSRELKDSCKGGLKGSCPIAPAPFLDGLSRCDLISGGALQHLLYPIFAFFLGRGFQPSDEHASGTSIDTSRVGDGAARAVGTRGIPLRSLRFTIFTA
ncbi:hypothetical protein BHE74_00032834, partial [Ensete ventricosum]